MLVVASYSFECYTTATNGMVHGTMSNTYNADDSSMWFYFERKEKKKIVTSGKIKIQIINDKKAKTLQYVVYDKNGNILETLNNGEYSEFIEVVPQSIGEWRWNVIKNANYLFNPSIKTEKDRKEFCSVIGYSIIQKTENSSDEKEHSMTIEETERWIKDNKPIAK